MGKDLKTLSVEKMELWTCFQSCFWCAVIPFQGLWDTQNSHFSVATSDSRLVDNLKAKR